MSNYYSMSRFPISELSVHRNSPIVSLSSLPISNTNNSRESERERLLGEENCLMAGARSRAFWLSIKINNFWSACFLFIFIHPRWCSWQRGHLHVITAFHLEDWRFEKAFIHVRIQLHQHIRKTQHMRALPHTHPKRKQSSAPHVQNHSLWVTSTHTAHSPVFPLSNAHCQKPFSEKGCWVA